MSTVNLSYWRRSRNRCAACKQWRRSEVRYGPCKSYVDRGHDPCIKDLPGKVWGCCGHGSQTDHLPGYIDGLGVRTFRFPGGLPGNLIRRALQRVSQGFSAPMWAVFDDDEDYERRHRRADRLVRQMNRRAG